MLHLYSALLKKCQNLYPSQRRGKGAHTTLSVAHFVVLGLQRLMELKQGTCSSVHGQMRSCSRGCVFSGLLFPHSRLLFCFELLHESNLLSRSMFFPLKSLPDRPPITPVRALAVPWTAPHRAGVTWPSASREMQTAGDGPPWRLQAALKRLCFRALSALRLKTGVFAMGAGSCVRQETSRGSAEPCQGWGQRAVPGSAPSRSSPAGAPQPQLPSGFTHCYSGSCMGNPANWVKPL